MTRKMPPTPPKLEDEPWRWEIEPLRLGVLGRYRVYLLKGFLRYGGNDGWGWSAWTYAGARRKAERELNRKLRNERKLELRSEWMDGGPSIREMKRRLRELDRLLYSRTEGQVLMSDVTEREALRAKLGLLR